MSQDSTPKLVLKDIKDKLTALCSDQYIPMEGVWYGACQEKDLSKWNYFVFRRLKTQKSSNRIDFETYYEVNIIHEEYIPEGYVEKVINALTGSGIKLKATSDPVEYNYTFKGNTNMVIEIATITIVRPEKRC